MQPFFLVIIAYLLGSISFGYLIVRGKEGADVRKTGSGGTGATNVSRRAGKAAGVLTLVLDALKGAAAVLIAQTLSGNGWVVTAAGVAVIVGHIFPVWLGFRGGKGVATGAGVAVVLMPVLFLITFAVWAVVLLTTRYMSLASLTAAVLIILLRLTWTTVPFGPRNVVVTTFCVVAALAVIVRHAGNIRRLIAGTENRLGGK